MKYLLLCLSFYCLQNTFGQVFIIEDFSDIETNSWSNVDGDGDGNSWQIGYPKAPTNVWQETNSVAISYSFDLSTGPLTPDNFLVSPPISFENYSGNLILRWRSGTTESTESDSFEEYYAVYLESYSTLGIVNKENFDNKTPLFSGYLSEGNSAILNQVNVSSFAGMNDLRLIFRHYNCTDEFNLFIDGISIENNAAVLSVDQNSLDDKQILVYIDEDQQMLRIKTDVKVKSATVYDVNGKIVISKRDVDNSLDVLNLDSGIYFVSILTEDNKSVTKKIIKN